MLNVEQMVKEIWKLDLVGGQPTLLDRGMKHHNGLLTYAESPPFIFPEGALEQAARQVGAHITEDIPVD